MSVGSLYLSIFHSVWSVCNVCYIYLSICIYVYMYVSMYVCVHCAMCACMYVCLSVCPRKQENLFNLTLPYFMQPHRIPCPIPCLSDLTILPRWPYLSLIRCYILSCLSLPDLSSLLTSTFHCPTSPFFSCPDLICLVFPYIT